MTRIFAVAMAAVLCFALLVPLALQRHNPALAVGVSAIFVLYAAANAYLWRRYPAKR
jgi:hypothetical protein